MPCNIYELLGIFDFLCGRGANLFISDVDSSE